MIRYNESGLDCIDYETNSHFGLKDRDVYFELEHMEDL